jgi:hypothetical protein
MLGAERGRKHKKVHKRKRVREGGLNSIGPYQFIIKFYVYGY